MTSISSGLSAVDDVARVVSPSRELRRFTTDTLITANRQNTPQAALDQRATQRLSIAELNELDMESIRGSLERTRSDARTPVEKFIDVIDLPRNALFNIGAAIAAPEFAAKQRAAGNVGAFGLPRVMASDVLRGAGVENRLILGIGGFIGDVALDPLTYVGGAGFGVKAGKTAISAGGKRSIKKGFKQFSRGGIDAVSTPEVRDVFAAIITESGEAFAKAKPAERLAILSERAFGETVQRGFVSNKFDQSLRAIGADERRGGSIISEGLERLSKVSGEGAELAFNAAERQSAQAAGDFIRRFGRAGQGIRLGPNAGTTIAHIPFTGKGIHVTSFTAAGTEAAIDRVLALNRAGNTGQAGVALQTLNQVNHATDEAGLAIEIAQELALTKNADDVARLTESLEEAVTASKEANKAIRNIVPADETRMAAFAEAGDVGDLVFLAHLSRSANDAHIRAETLERLSKLRQSISGRAGNREALAALGAPPPGVVAEGGERQSRLFAMDEAMDSLRDVSATRNAAEAADELAPLAGREASMNTGELAFLDGMNNLEKAVVDLSDDNAELFGQLVESYQDSVQAALALANSTNTNVIRSLRYDEWIMVKLAQRFTNTGTEAAGASLLQALGDVTRRITPGDDGAIAGYLERTDRNVRGLFGRRSGEVSETRASLMNAFLQKSRDVGLRRGRQIADDVQEVLTNAGMKDVELDEVLSVLTALAVQKADPVSRLFWATRFDPDPSVLNPSPFVAKIELARAKGLLSDPVVDKALTDIAEREAIFFQTLGKQALEDGLLNDLLPGYIPVRLKVDAQKALRDANRLGNLPANTIGSVGGKQDFQKARGTLEYRFLTEPNPGAVDKVMEELVDGLVKSGMDVEEVKAIAAAAKEEFISGGTRMEQLLQAEIDRHRAMTFDEIRQLGLASADDAKLALISKLRINSLEKAAQKRFGDGVSLADNADIIRAEFARQSDPISLSDMAETKRFSFLKGDIIAPGDLFETNLAVLSMRRLTAQVKAAAQRSFINQVVGPNSLLVPGGNTRQSLAAAADGANVTVNGVTGVVKHLDGVPGSRILRIGPVNYRFVNKTVLDDSLVPLLGDLDGGQYLDALFPEIIAENIERFADLFRQEKVNALFNASEDIVKFWKSTTLVHPSWVVVNAVGNTILAAMAGVNLAQMTVRLKDAQRIARGRLNPSMIEGREILIRGVPTKLTDIASNVEQGRLANASRSYFTEIEAVASKMIEPDLRTAQRMGAIANAPKTSKLRRVKESVLLNLSDTLNAAKEVRGPGQAANFVSDALSRNVLQPWFRANALMEDTQRIAVYLAFLDEGFDSRAAIDKTIRGLFDYTDFTVTEQTIRRHLIPFFSWIRSNAPHQIEQLFRNPKFAGNVPRVRDALEQSINGEANIPQNQRPRFIRDQITVQIGTDPSTRYGLTLNSLSPTQEGFQAGATLARIAGGDLGEAAQEFLRGLVSSFSPTIKTPFEIGAGREVFTQREIGPDPLSGDLSVGEVIAGQFRPFREFGVGSARQGPIQRAFGQGVGSGASRLLLGGRVQSLEEERIRSQLLRDFTGKERGIRRAIAIAEREGREGTSLNARTELLILYRDMVQAGLEDKVPKWALAQLTSASSAPSAPSSGP